MSQEKEQKIQGKSTTPLVNPKLLELLWRLKEQYQTTIDSKLPLNKLIQNLDYRKNILNSALSSNDNKSRDLAWEILRLQKELESQNETKPLEQKPHQVSTPDLEENPIQPNTKLSNKSQAREKLGSHEKTQKLQTRLKNAIPESRTTIQAPVLKQVVQAEDLRRSKASKENNNISSLFATHKKAIFGFSLILILSVLGVLLSDFDSDSTAEKNTPESLVKPVTPAPNINIPVNDTPGTRLFSMHGSNTIGENLAPALLKTYMLNNGAEKTDLIVTDSPLDRQLIIANQDNSHAYIELSSHGSSTGFRALLDGKADLGMSSRKIKDTEVEKLTPIYGNMLSPRSEHIIGLDGLAIIVHPDNPINSLSTKQIAKLFSGEISNWASVGGKDLPVSVYARENNSGTWDTFKSLVLKPNKTKLVNSAQRFESSSQLSDKVAEDQGGIGFIALPYVRYSKLLAVSEGKGTMPIVPTAFTIGTEDYPLSRRLYLYLPKNADNQLKSFVEFVHSNAGQDVVQEHGFVSQNLYALKPYRDQSYPKQYLDLTKNAQRLSLNFRFNVSSNRLDNKASRDLNRVVEYLFKHQGHRVLLFGFTDSIGNKKQNMALSQKRVQTIADALSARGIFPAVSQGFGEAIPIASNKTAYGRYKNRRVEIWIE